MVMLFKMRENSKRIAERMGWSSIKILDRYSHITPHMQRETVDAFGEMFFSAPTMYFGGLCKCIFLPIKREKPLIYKGFSRIGRMGIEPMTPTLSR
nr:hypothetical protein [Paenibacillus pinistramenti]